jgi:parallel beta-helix repeat protein
LQNYPNLLPANNQSRNGRITENTVYRCLSPIAISAGIYLDGSKNIKVDNNDCYHNGVGISVGNEQDSSTASGQLVQENVLYENLGAGIYIGSNNPSSVVENSVIKWNTISHNYYIDPNLYRRTQGRYGTLDSAGMWAEVVFNRARNITFEENEITSGSDIVSAYLYGQTNLTLRYNEYFTLHNDPCNAWFIRDTTGDGIPDVFYNTFHLYVKRTGWDATSQLGNVAYNVNGCGTSLLARQASSPVNRITAFPNPTTDRLKIILQQAKTGLVDIKLWDVTGKLVLAQQKQLPAGVQMIDLWQHKPAPGLYFLQVNKEVMKIVIR